jgi:hypothetical protein
MWCGSPILALQKHGILLVRVSDYEHREFSPPQRCVEQIATDRIQIIRRKKKKQRHVQWQTIVVWTGRLTHFKLAVLVWVSPLESATCEKRFSPQDRDLPRDPKKVQNRTWTIMQGNPTGAKQPEEGRLNSTHGLFLQ